MSRSATQIERREQEILEAAPFEADHVPDSEDQRFDARMREAFAATSTISVVGAASVPAGARLELKTCQIWITDLNSGGGRRRGQFQITESTHDQLRNAGGFYSFLVLRDDDRIVAGRIVSADEIDELASWTSGGRRLSCRRAILPWFKIIPKTEVEGVSP